MNALSVAEVIAGAGLIAGLAGVAAALIGPSELAITLGATAIAFIMPLIIVMYDR